MQRLKKKKTETGLLPDDFSAEASLPPNDFDFKKKNMKPVFGRTTSP